MKKVGRWPTVDYGPLERHKVFSLQHVQRTSPRTGRAGTFQVLHTPTWVNVVALTEADEVVLIRQYRHGIDDVTLEIPGGLVDEGEEPAVAAARELAEETGYTGDAPVLLGEVHPNPAIQTNVCSTWLVRNAALEHPPRPDDDEHISVELAPLAGIEALIRDGSITHALVICAFHHLGLRSG